MSQFDASSLTKALSQAVRRPSLSVTYNLLPSLQDEFVKEEFIQYDPPLPGCIRKRFIQKSFPRAFS
jgi:hypothetical protein